MSENHKWKVYPVEAESLLNKLVKIECAEDKISISEITLKEAEKFWDSRITKIEIPSPNITLQAMKSRPFYIR